jgi:D-arabinitol 4-dehydrogenase
VGAFHRAHQAAYLHRLRLAGERRWRLVVGNIRNDDAETLRHLAASRGLYTLETVTPSGVHRFETIDAIDQIVPWRVDLADLISVGAHPDTRIISCTVTEAGYYLDGDALKLDDADIGADLRETARARPGSTLYGALLPILRQRMECSAGPLTVLSCDNLRHNGRRLRLGLLQFLDAAKQAHLADWVKTNVSFPNSMVDRITPRPDATVRARVRAATGREDPAAVMSESFIQWVVEDNFVAGRPAFERVGVQFVVTAAPYEEAKIRILNGSHSCIGWAGALAGFEFVHEAIQDERIRGLVADYVADVIPCLPAVGLNAYCETVLERFGNPYLKDTLSRIAQDSFSKFSGYVLPTIRDRIASGASIEGVAALPALLLRFLQRWNAGELFCHYQDGQSAQASARRICASTDPVAALVSDAALFGNLGSDHRIADAVHAKLASIDAAMNRR